MLARACSCVIFRDARTDNRHRPIISRFVDYRPIVVYTVGNYRFLFLLPKVNKHDSGFRFQ